MQTSQVIMFASFIFVLGCCIGSFLNVVIWRLPYRGEQVSFKGKTGPLTLSWPPSHCPKCDSPVEWYQNIPIFSWLFLRGKCANCASAISIRYPLVEAGTGMLFMAIFLALFVGHCLDGFDVPGDNLPATATMILYLIMAAFLLAASGIDADWYIIPAPLTVGLTIVGLIAVPLIPPVTAEYMPTLSTGDPAMYRTLSLGTIGGMVGWVMAVFLLWKKWIPRSFAQMEAEASKQDKSETKSSEHPAVAPLPTVTKKLAIFVTAGLIIATTVVCWVLLSAKIAAPVTLAGGVCLFLLGVLPRDAGSVDVTQEVVDEISGPDARKEVLKELLFVLIPIAFALLAVTFQLQVSQAWWVRQLLASVAGFLAGGGVVWLVRIFATLGFGREAMGLGDAHLMAAVGAVIGAPLVILAFFIAPFLGLVWGIILKLMGKPNVLPYGPWLSIASIVSVLYGVRIWDHVQLWMHKILG